MSNVLHPDHCQASRWTTVKEACVQDCETSHLIVRPLQTPQVDVGIFHLLRGKAALARQLASEHTPLSLAIASPLHRVRARN